MKRTSCFFYREFYRNEYADLFATHWWKYFDVDIYRSLPHETISHGAFGLLKSTLINSLREYKRFPNANAQEVLYCHTYMRLILFNIQIRYWTFDWSRHYLFKGKGPHIHVAIDILRRNEHMKLLNKISNINNLLTFICSNMTWYK